MEIQENARKEKCFRDSEWDLQFHVQVALATQNTNIFPCERSPGSPSAS
jgi:DNA-binding FadR family transcriptional regulator